MGIAIAIAVVALLLAGFLVLTTVEAKRGTRLAPSVREKLDGVAAEAVASLGKGRILTRATQSVSAATRHAAHEVAHVVLAGIRAAERALTRVVRYMRESNAAHALSRREKPAPEGTTGAEVE